MASRPSIGIGRKEPCAKCLLPVFLAERLTVGTKLYHRTCFRCARCDHQLSLANCYETENGVYCCETCPDEEISKNPKQETPESTHMLLRSVSDEQKSASLKRDTTDYSQIEDNSPIAKSRKEFWSTHLLTEEELDNIIIQEDEPSTSSETPPKSTEGSPAPKRTYSSILKSKYFVESPKTTPEASEDKTEKSPFEGVVFRRAKFGASAKFEEGPPKIEEGPPKLKEGPPKLKEGPPKLKEGPPKLKEGPSKLEEEPSKLDFSSGHGLKSFSSGVLNDSGGVDGSASTVPRKLDPPDLESLPTSLQSVYSVNMNTDQQNAALDVTKDRNSLVKSRKLIFENVPSKNSASINVPSKNTKENVPKDNILKYFGPQSVSDENLTKNESQKTLKDLKKIEAISKYLPKTESPSGIKKDFLRTRTKSKSYDDISENDDYKTAQSEIKGLESDTSYTYNTPPNFENRPKSTPNIPRISVNDISLQKGTPVKKEASAFKQEDSAFKKEDSASNKEASAFKNEDTDVKESLLFETASKITENDSTEASSLKLELAKEISKSKEDIRGELSKYEAEVKESLQKSRENLRKSRENLATLKIASDEVSSSTSPEQASKIASLKNSASKITLEIQSLKEEIDSSTTSLKQLDTSNFEATSRSSKTLPPKFSKEEYPQELNPFGSDEENDQLATPLRVIRPSKEDSIISPISQESPLNVNRKINFSQELSLSSRSESESKDQNEEKKILKAPRISLNPFWSDEDEEEEKEKVKPVPLPRRQVETPEPRPRRTGVNAEKYDSTSSLSSLNSSIGSTPNRKKKPAPKPPTEKYHTLSPGSPSSLPVTPKTHRKTRKAPLPPTSTPMIPVGQDSRSPISPSDSGSFDKLNESSDIEREKNDKDSKNRNRQSQNSDESPKSYIPDKSTFGKWKRKKGPAPSRPVPQRRKIQPLPMAQIKEELQMIELQQQGMERQGVKLEQMIREKCDVLPDDAPMPPDVEEYVIQLFELVNEKNELFRRQAELMYLRRQQRLEEEHADLEYQIRCLMDQPECNKTDTDKAREEELINRLVEVVERRNEIVECLEMDRVREAEEDLSITSRLTWIQTKREEETLKSLTESPSKLSKKEKKKIKKEKKLKEKGKNIDIDKDIDETEIKNVNVNIKKKKKWF